MTQQEYMRSLLNVLNENASPVNTNALASGAAVASNIFGQLAQQVANSAPQTNQTGTTTTATAKNTQTQPQSELGEASLIDKAVNYAKQKFSGEPQSPWARPDDLYQDMADILEAITYATVMLTENDKKDRVIYLTPEQRAVLMSFGDTTRKVLELIDYNEGEDVFQYVLENQAYYLNDSLWQSTGFDPNAAFKHFRYRAHKGVKGQPASEWLDIFLQRGSQKIDQVAKRAALIQKYYAAKSR